LQSPVGDSSGASTPLLARDEASPVIVENAGASSPFLLLGDHAGRTIPRALGDLGVPQDDLERHIAWDIGVAGLGARLAEALGATFIRQRYSRLVIDCNREPGRTDAIPAVSDGTAIPGNAELTADDRRARHAAIAAPYHAAIAAELDARAERVQQTVLISLHSFTPTMEAFVRPWRFGVLHAEDSPYSRRVLAQLRSKFGDEVGDNLPYRMDEVDFTVPFHARPRGLDYLELEVRQDIITEAAGQMAVARLLERLLAEALG
jgi:predicted N-formylglutamate amidohydrolase